MATTKRTTTKPVDKETAPETKPKETTKQKKFSDHDLIACRSITSGELLMVGDKSKLLYRWADYGDVEFVEYQDLLYAARSSRTGYVKYPRFIIMDEDFVSQNKEISKLYEGLYTTDDFREILKKSPSEIKAIVSGMPKGAQESMKHLAASMIETGALDSVRTIKVLDEIFGTEMFLALANH